MQIGIYSEIDSILIDRALLRAASWIAENLADIGEGEFDALLLERVRQETERRFLDGAFAGVGIGRLQIICLLVLLR